MAKFSLDFNDVFDGRIDDGEYEVVVSEVEENVTPGGTEYIQFDLIIRNDVDQPHQNKHIFHKVWRSKETGKYNMRVFNTIGKACRLQNGKTYNSLQELLDDFRFKTARVTVKNEESEYKGKIYNNLNVKFWDESQINGPLNHTFKDENDNKTVGEIFADGGAINDDDLPF